MSGGTRLTDTLRPSSSTRNPSPPTTTGATPARPGRPRRRHRGLQPGHRARPQTRFAYSDRGAARYSQGDWPAPSRTSTQAIELDPNTPPPTTTAATLARQGRPGGAIEDYDQAIELDPKMPRLQRPRLRPLGQGGPGRAIADDDKAIELDPNTPWPTTTAASPTRRRATWPAIAGLRARPSSSTPNTPGLQQPGDAC